jgi:hypothetical protein
VQNAPDTAAPPEPTLGSEQASAREATAFAAPNMVGHLLFGSRSIDFRYNRAAGPINVANNGSTGLINPAVADDNSPVPRDRVGFRYNYFNDAQQVTGFGPPIFAANGVGTSFAQTRVYDVNQYTFNFEKTFLDGWGSVELRVPFSTGLSNNLDLSAGDITGPAAGPGGGPVNTPNGPAFNVNATPAQTLGREGTQFGNMTLIFKGVGYRSSSCLVSGGVGVGIPSGADTSVLITDYSGGTVQGQASLQRERLIHIDNETWSLSPFLAALYAPTERFFTQGFLQVDIPLNASTINYADTLTRGTVFPLPAALTSFPTLTPPFAVRSGISEQPLLQVDWGAGYWLMRDTSRRCITGIAPSLELHYTTTLKDASVVQLPGDPFLQLNPQNRLVQEQPPRVGNLRNRVDILDMTAATTFLISDRATLATAVTFPLKSGDNRTFDWEFQVQFNYYFGGLRTPPRFAPNF